MKILYLHQYFSTPRTAGGTRSYEMAQHLISRGHKVIMVCVHNEKTELELSGDTLYSARCGIVDGIQVIQFNLTYSNYLSMVTRTWLFLRYALSSVKLALRIDYDLIFATSTPLTAGIPGIFARWLRNKPFVFEVRDLWPELPRAMGAVKNPFVLASMSILEWVTYRAATACIALSPGIKEGIARRSPKGRKIAMIPNGCDLDLFRPGCRAELALPGIGSKDCVAVFTGAHGMANGLDAVLDAAHELLQRRRNDIVLVFIGDGKLKPYLMQRAHSEGLHNCRFFDPIPKNKLSRIVSCCDIGLMILDDVPAFYYGTSPNKFFDYISAGLPVVNNYPGWLADMIHKHHCGEAVPPRNPKAFADGLCKLADDIDLHQVYSRNSRQLAEQLFSRERLAAEFSDWLENQRRASSTIEVDR